MKAYYLRLSRRYLGFGRVVDTLWPQYRVGWMTVDSFPEKIASRFAEILKTLGRKDVEQ